jgi:tRNA uridine 5-carboxymethylaminomethyl modification enzyme
VLRHDTADTRLLPKAKELKLISDERWEHFQKKIKSIDYISGLLKERKITPSAQIMKPEALINELATFELSSFPREWVERVCFDIKYSGYIEKEKRAAAKLAKMDAVKIPPDINYVSLLGLSAEAKEKLIKVRPVTVGQAARIPGIRQGDIALLMIISVKR